MLSRDKQTNEWNQYLYNDSDRFSILWKFD